MKNVLAAVALLPVVGYVSGGRVDLPPNELTLMDGKFGVTCHALKNGNSPMSWCYRQEGRVLNLWFFQVAAEEVVHSDAIQAACDHAHSAVYAGSGGFGFYTACDAIFVASIAPDGLNMAAYRLHTTHESHDDDDDWGR